MQRLVLVFLLILTAVTIFIYSGLAAPTRPSFSFWSVQVTPTTVREEVYASGVIEVRQVFVAPEVSGQLLRVLVEEGDEVQQGDVLAEIESSFLQAQLGEAEAAVAVAQARLAQVEAGARSEDIAVAEAAAELARVQRDTAYRAWQDAILLRDDPQQLDLEIAAARAAVAVADRRIEQAVALKDAAELLNGLRERQARQAAAGVDVQANTPAGPVTVHVDVDQETRLKAWAGWNLASSDVWSAYANLNAANAARAAAQSELDSLLAIRANQQEAEVKIAQAEAAYKQAVAAVDVAERQVELARAGASEEQVAVARAVVDQAQATVDSLRAQLAKYTLRSPLTGLVLASVAEAGSMALPGRTLFTLAALDVVELVLYIPEADLGRVSLGQEAAIAVDAFPGETFTGTVSWISDRAEFMPKNAQTSAERARMVYAVKVVIANPDHKLKPGMPADAVLQVR